jgi:hypothetical protein
MPGKARQRGRVDGAQFDQRLRRCDHLDDPAVLQPQSIAVAQRYGIRQIEQKIETLTRRHRDSPPVAIMVFEGDRIRRFGRPRSRGNNRRDAQHTVSPSDKQTQPYRLEEKKPVGL